MSDPPVRLVDVFRRLIAKIPKVPVPEYVDVVWAAGGRTPGEQAPILAAVMFAVELLCVPATFVITALGWYQVGIAVWAVAGVCDYCAVRQDTKFSRLVDYVGLKHNLRALLRSLLVLVPLSMIFAPWPTALELQLLIQYLFVVIVIQLVWVALVLIVNVLSAVAPLLRYHPQSTKQDAEFSAYARIYQVAVRVPLAMLVGEGAFLAAWAVFFSFPGSGLDLGLFNLLSPWAAAIPIGFGLWVYRAFRKSLRTARDAEEGLIAELAERRPQYLAYISLGTGQSNYIANQWLPVLDRVPEPGFMLVREASQLLPLGQTKLPVYYAPRPRQVESLSLESVRVALYPAFGDRNAQLMRDPRLAHVMILHGDSDKASSFNAIARSYDEIWVAGEVGIERYWDAGIDIPRSRFVIVGRPQVEGLAQGPLAQEPKVVLYAPTFEGYFDQNNYTSLAKMGPALAEWLVTRCPEAELWFKPHPSTGILIPSMLGARGEVARILRQGGDSNAVISDPGYPINDCLQRADVLVSDVSSVVTDFLYTERPIVVCNPDGLDEAEFFSRYPSLGSCYLLAPDLSNADEIFAAVFGPDPKAPDRLAAKKRLLGDLPQGPQQAFNAAMTALIGAQTRRVAAVDAQ
jgi:hypothetical protein